MSYPISAPVDFSAPGLVELTLTNTTSPGSIVWDISTDASDGLVLGTNNPASADVLHLFPDSLTDPSGAAQTPRLRLINAGFGVNVEADAALAASYNFKFPALASTGDAQIIASQGLTNVFYDVHPKNTITVRKNPGPNEFSTLLAAIASIPTIGPDAPSATNMYNIHVSVGEYNETATCVVPSYVYVIGESMESVTFGPAAMGYSILKFSKNSGMVFCSLSNSDPALPAIDCNNCGEFVILHKLTVLGSCPRFLSCVTDGTATENSSVYLEYVDTTDSLVYTLLCQDTNILGGFGSIVHIENFFTFGHNDDSIIVDGPNTQLLSHASELRSDGTGNCIRVKNSGHTDIRGMAITGYTNGFLVDNDGGIPHIVTAGIIYEANTVNINIPNTLATGQATGYTEYLKTLVPKTAPFFITGTDPHIITVAPKGADFTSVNAALAAITDNSPTDRYTIFIHPGVYVETQIVLKSYVTLTGFFQTQCILAAHPSVAGTPFIVGAGYSALNKLTLTTTSYATSPSYLVEFQGDPAGVHFRCDDIIFDSSADYVHIGSTNGQCIFLLISPLFNMSAPFVNGVYIEDSGPSNFPITFVIDNLIWGADATGVTAVNEIIKVQSFKSPAPFQNIFGAVTNCSMGTNFYGPAGIGFTFEGAVYIVVETCLFGGMTTALRILPSSEPTFMIMASSTISNNTTDIDIQSAVAYGSIAVNATISKTFIVPGANFGINILDPSGTIGISGDIVQGIEWDQLTNISEQIQHASTCGYKDVAPMVTSVGGLNVSVDGGTGYLMVGPLTANYLKYVTWSAVPSLALVDNALNWIYVNASGTVSTTPSDPEPTSTINLGAVKTYAGGITYIQEVGHQLNNLSTKMDDVLRDVFGPIVQSGCLATPGSSLVERAAAVSSGSYWLSIQNFPPVGGDNVSMIGYYGDPSIETVPFTNIPLAYDTGTSTFIGGTGGVPSVTLTTTTTVTLATNQVISGTGITGGTFIVAGATGTSFTMSVANTIANGTTITASPAPIPAGKWVKHAIYILSSLAGVTQYFMVYGQQLFDLELDADTGLTPTPPPTFTANMCPVSGVVVTDSDPSSPLALSRFRDIRPTLSFRSDGTTASADHNSLLNLTVGNAHPQYFRVDGTSVMAGDINLDGQDIFGTGGNLLNGVDITAHAARHLPGGPDALTTGMPVNVGSANAQGAAAAFSRSDHVHNHGAQTDPTQHAVATSFVNGFMSSTDKSKLDASTELDVASTLVQRDANGMIQISELQIQSDSTIYHMSFKASPSGFGGPHHNIFFPVPATDDTVVYLAQAQSLTNKTIIGSTNTVAASQLRTTGADVVVSGSAPPSANNVLVSSSPTAAAWGTVPNGALTNSSLTVTAGTGLSGGGVVSLGGTTTLNNAGVLSVKANAGAAEVGALTLANGTNVSIVDSPAGTFTFNVPTGAGGVTTFSAGTTGFTPSPATSGAITLAGTLIAANGGTGQSSYAVGDLLYANTTSTLARLADVAVDNALISGGVGVAPSWGKISNATLTNSSITVTAGTGLSGGGVVSLGGTTTLNNAGVLSITGTANQVSTSAATGNLTLSTPSTFIAPGTIKDTTGLYESTSATVSAAGATQGTATGLTTSYVVVTTVAASTGVRLPVPTSSGLMITIVNRGANTLNVYPASGAAIDAAGTNVAVSLLVGGTATYQASTVTQWYTVNPPIVAGAGATVTYGNGQTSVSATGTTPGGVNTNVQYNNAGAFGGSSSFNFISGANPRVDILGTTATNQLRIGGATDVGTATVYIETNNTDNEGQRVYFNSGLASTSGWISYAYDGSTPYLKITDADDDPPYMTFDTIGSGTYAAPQYCSAYGARGPYAGRTNGFAWYIGNNTSGSALITAGSPQMEMDSQWLRIPGGTTAQRPGAPSNGMMRYNSTLISNEFYVPAMWVQNVGVANKDTANVTVTSAAATNIVSYSIPATSFGVDGMYSMTTGGTWGNTSGATRTVTITISFGGTTMWQGTSSTLASGNTVGWNMDLMLASNNSATSQTLSGQINIGATGSPTTGTGSIANSTTSPFTCASISGTSAINTGTTAGTWNLNISVSGNNSNFIKLNHVIQRL